MSSKSTPPAGSRTNPVFANDGHVGGAYAIVLQSPVAAGAAGAAPPRPPRPCQLLEDEIHVTCFYRVVAVERRLRRRLRNRFRVVLGGGRRVRGVEVDVMEVQRLDLRRRLLSVSRQRGERDHERDSREQL